MQIDPVVSKFKHLRSNIALVLACAFGFQILLVSEVCSIIGAQLSGARPKGRLPTVVGAV